MYKIKGFDLIVLINHLLSNDSILMYNWNVGKLRSDLNSINIKKHYLINLDIDKCYELDIIDFNKCGINPSNKYFTDKIWSDALDWQGLAYAKILSI